MAARNTYSGGQRAEMRKAIKELREAGFMEHGSDGYTVTLQGQDLLKRLNDLQAFANRWVKNKD